MQEQLAASNTKGKAEAMINRLQIRLRFSALIAQEERCENSGSSRGHSSLHCPDFCELCLSIYCAFIEWRLLKQSEGLELLRA